MSAQLTGERLRALVHFDPTTGVFTRRIRTAQRHQVGDRADLLITAGGQSGYRRVCVDSARFLAHRLAWLYANGEWPAHDIDHLDGDRGNNRIANLRDVPNRVNRQNVRRARRDSSTGLLGVVPMPNGMTWRARIQIDGRGIHLGVFDTAERAHTAYIEAKRRHHEGCTL